MAQVVAKLECHLGPITALVVCSQRVVSGCGCEVSVFDPSTGRLHTRKQILSGASVHGIRQGSVHAEGQLLCVYGAKQARVILLVTLENGSDLHISSDIVEVNDWIWDARWLSDEPSCGSIALALAHNSVLQWNWQSSEISIQRECTEKCILYCAHFIGDTWDNLLLAAGTVFNKVVLWPVGCQRTKTCRKEQNPIEVIHTFSGHKGVIFSINYHAYHQRLCSVSDDRSIRMWQLSFTNGKQAKPSIQDWISAKSDFMFCLYGHSARVWDVALQSNYFASVGEDATCYIWDYAGHITHKFKGHKGRSIWSLAISEDEKFVLTGGGDASIRMWEIQEKTTQMLQRNISIPDNLTMIQDDFPRSVKLLDFDTVLVMMNSGGLFSYSVTEQYFNQIVCDPKFRSYSVVSPCPDQLTVALGSMTGAVRIIRLREVGSRDLQHIESNLFSGKVLSLAWLDNTYIVASGSEGLCILLKIDTVQDADIEETSVSLVVSHRINLPPSKHRWITSATFVPTSVEWSDTACSLLVCGDKNGSVHCYQLSQACDDKHGVEPSQSFDRAHGKAGVTFVCFRDGNVYTTGRDGFYRKWEVMSGKLSQLHGNKIVKGFEWIDHLEWYNGDLLLYGFFSSQFVVWSVSYNQQLMSVQCGGGHRAWDCHHDNNMLRFVYLKAGKVYMVDSGHQTKQTIVQPALHGRELCDVKYLQVMQDDEGMPIHVACSASEDTTINVGAFINEDSFTHWIPLVTLKGHLSSVRALAVSDASVTQKFREKRQIVPVTEGKDTDVPLPPNAKQGHFILFSGGGRAEIRAWRLNVTRHKVNSISKNVMQKQVLDHADSNRESSPVYDLPSHQHQLDSASYIDSPCSHLCSPPNSSTKHSPVQCKFEHLATHFLGESRHKKLYSTWKTHKLRLDPETRIMSLTASPLVDLWGDHLGSSISESFRQEEGSSLSHAKHLSNVHILSSAGSDGVFRVFTFDELTRKFSALRDTTYHQGCILKVLHYVHHTHQDSQGQRVFALSASTNGNIVFWSLDQLVTKLISSILSESVKFSVHHSDGQCLDLREGYKNAVGYDHHVRLENDTERDDEDDYIDFTKSEMGATNEEEWVPVCSLKAHQSGVNSLHALQISASRLLVASGGDDNAVTVQLLEVSESGIRVLAKLTEESAHAAQVTGIWLISPAVLVSTSIDQRIIIWKIKQSIDEQMKLQMVSCKYIHVADVSSMDVCLHRNSVYLCIGGEGLCLYSFSAANSEDHDWMSTLGCGV